MLIKPGEQFDKKQVSSSKTAYQVFLHAHLSLDEVDRDKEHIWVIGLTRRNRIKFLDHVATGTLSGCLTAAREVYRRAVLHAADSVLMGHNHPSGNLKPSCADDVLTERMKNAGIVLDIELLDHIVFTDEGFFSYADEGKL